MLGSYYLKHAHEIMAEVRSNTRATPEVLLAARIEKVVKSMIEKTQGRGNVQAPKIRCGIVGKGPALVAEAIHALRCNYQPVSAWMTEDPEHEIIIDAESEPIPVTQVYEQLLPYYVASNDPAYRRALAERMDGSMLFGNASFDPTVVRASDTYAQPGTTVGAFSYLGHFVHLGSLVSVGTHVSFAGDVVVGDYTVIESHVTVMPGARIGAGCVIRAGSVISEGAVVKPGAVVVPFP